MTEDDAKKAILKLFQCFNVNGSDAERKIKFAAYWEVLSRLPMGIVIAVCGGAARGTIGPRGFLPSSAELYQAGVNMLPRTTARRIDAPEISQEKREEISTLIRELAASMNAIRDAKKYVVPKQAPMDVEEFLAAKYLDKPLPKLSAELRAKLGAGIPELTE